MKRILILALAATGLFTSCKKDNSNNYNADKTGSLSIEFDNIVGGQNLVLNNGSYTNSSGESYNITTLRYFISNIKLMKSDGTEYVVPQDSSYFLIDESDANMHEAKVNIPEGEYTSLTFTVGVDSLRSTMDISRRTGALDPAGAAQDMYWSWNSGYIFFKMEGTSSASTATGNMFMYHIGGFGGYTTPTINNIKNITLDLTAGGTPKVRSGHNSNIHLMVDVSKVFDGPSKISIAANPTVMSGDITAAIAANYATMFRHDHTENE